MFTFAAADVNAGNPTIRSLPERLDLNDTVVSDGRRGKPAGDGRGRR